MPDFQVNDDLNYSSNSPFDRSILDAIKDQIDYYLPNRAGGVQKVHNGDTLVVTNPFDEDYLSDLIDTTGALSIDLTEINDFGTFTPSSFGGITMNSGATISSTKFFILSMVSGIDMAGDAIAV